MNTCSLSRFARPFSAVLSPLRRLTTSSSLLNEINPDKKRYAFHDKTTGGLTLLENLFEKHSSKNNLSIEEWGSFKEGVVAMKGVVNNAGFDSLMMMYLRNKNRYKLARSFIEFVRSKTVPNVTTLAQYMALCGQCMDETTEDEVVSVFKEIHPDALLHVAVVSQVVQGLVQTSRWRDCMQIMRNLEPHRLIWSEVASAAFRNGDNETAWSLLKELQDSEIEPADEVFEECVRCATVDGGVVENTKATLTKMLDFCRNNRIIISAKCANELQLVFRQLSLKGKFVTNKSLACSSCSESLQRADLTQSELKFLQDSIASKVVIGSNIFLQSRPEEVMRFFRFIKNVGLYDIVVDGLNISYTNQSHFASRHLASQLFNVINYLSRKKTVLMIGRQHMLKWPRQTMAAIGKVSACFFAEDLSKDDPFFLYAALFGGPNTQFVSNDMLRDHRVKLDDNEYMRILFDRWRMSHQIRFLGLDRAKKVQIVYPVEQDIRVQGSWENGWHIPYKDDSRELEPYEYCTTWLCAVNKNN